MKMQTYLWRHFLLCAFNTKRVVWSSSLQKDRGVTCRTRSQAKSGGAKEGLRRIRENPQESPARFTLSLCFCIAIRPLIVRATYDRRGVGQETRRVRLRDSRGTLGEDARTSLLLLGHRRPSHGYVRS